MDRAGCCCSCITALIVFSPKLLALLVWSAGKLPGWPQRPRFVAGVLIEAAMSAATAPILMVSQTMAVVSTLLGRDAGWRSQSRNTGERRRRTAARAGAMAFTSSSALHSRLAVVAHDIGMALWTAPVALSLVFAGPISTALARTPRRRSLLWRLMATPEDIAPPKVVRAALRAGMTMGIAEVAPAPARVPRDGCCGDGGGKLEKSDVGDSAPPRFIDRRLVGG